jgi:uncharacterized membrane protein YcaP (DUF421 family)
LVDIGELIGLSESEDLLTLLIRVVVLYVVIVAAVRLTCKRGIGQATAIDFILALAIGDIIGEMAYGTENILKGVLIIAIWVILHALTSFLEIKVPTLSQIISGEKRLVIKDGAMVKEELKKEMISEDEVLMLLRSQSIEDISVVRKAYLEPDGSLSVFKKDRD